LGAAFGPVDGDLLVDLLVDQVRRRNIKPTLGKRLRVRWVDQIYLVTTIDHHH
jgi:hypothetical protein